VERPCYRSADSQVRSVSRFISVHFHPLSFLLAFAFPQLTVLVFLQASFFFCLPISLLFHFLVHLFSLHLVATYVIPPLLYQRSPIWHSLNVCEFFSSNVNRFSSFVTKKKSSPAYRGISWHMVPETKYHRSAPTSVHSNPSLISDQRRQKTPHTARSVHA